ncbi:hypothetical protein CRUP_028554 [Coryphaenoides rupestris]|nr:hypothetical protein CRUP_028554 [Coryphaenoides rupestris]
MGRARTTATASWRPPPSPPPPPHGLEEVKVALRQSVEEFELRYTLAFNDLSSQLPVTAATAYGSFKSVMDEVFRDGINWGRIVGLFAFGGTLCVECVDKEMSHMVPRVAEWMTTYLDDHKRWLLVGVLVLTGVLLGALIAKKYV